MAKANLKKPRQLPKTSEKPMRVAVCGHYARGKSLADGQTVKIQTILHALIDVYGEDKVAICDTYKWKHHPLRLLFECIKIANVSDDIIILPANKGIRVFLPLFHILGKKYNNRLHYSVIGGWLPEVLRKHKYLLKYLRDFKSVQVETARMKEELSDFKLNNIRIAPNFKAIEAVSTKKLAIAKKPPMPYALCTFSRVIAEKGIDDAIEAVSRVNDHFGNTVYTLDIYGSIGEEYKDHFNKISTTFPEYIQYKGVIKSDKTVEVLSKYYLLLFPTHFHTEGMPGSIIDAYAAGLPVVSSRWNSFSDIIVEGETGYGVGIGDNGALFKTLCSLLDTNKVLPLKEKCTLAFKPFSYESGCKRLVECLEDKQG